MTDTENADRMTRLMAIGDKLAERLDQAADGMDGDIDPLALQRLSAALKTLRDVAETEANRDAEAGAGLTVTFEGMAGEAAE